MWQEGRCSASLKNSCGLAEWRHKVQILVPDIEGLKSEAGCWDIKPLQKEENSPTRAVKLQGMWKLLEKLNLEAADSKKLLSREDVHLRNTKTQKAKTKRK